MEYRTSYRGLKVPEVSLKEVRRKHPISNRSMPQTGYASLEPTESLRAPGQPTREATPAAPDSAHSLALLRAGAWPVAACAGVLPASSPAVSEGQGPASLPPAELRYCSREQIQETNGANARNCFSRSLVKSYGSHEVGDPVPVVGRLQGRLVCGPHTLCAPLLQLQGSLHGPEVPQPGRGELSFPSDCDLTSTRPHAASPDTVPELGSLKLRGPEGHLQADGAGR